jgi:hypothetical protein
VTRGYERARFADDEESSAVHVREAAFAARKLAFFTAANKLGLQSGEPPVEWLFRVDRRSRKALDGVVVLRRLELELRFAKKHDTAEDRVGGVADAFGQRLVFDFEKTRRRKRRLQEKSEGQKRKRQLQKHAVP